MTRNYRNRMMMWLGLAVMAVSQPVVAVLMDPTRPDANGEDTPSFRGLVLQSTLTSAGRKLAIINGKTVKVGDSVNGAQVVRIEPHTVLLRKGDGHIRLRLLPEAVKSRTSENRGKVK